MVDICSIFDELKKKYKSDNKIIVTNEKFLAKDMSLKIFVSKIGDKKKLLDLAKMNVNEFKHELKIMHPFYEDKNDVLLKIKDKLGLKKLPFIIECFDNSNLQGKYPVASCVVFENGEPAKKKYRHFKVRTVAGPDDYKTMQEIIYRRYKNNINLPDLIIVDGGKGQLNSAVKILKELNIFEKVEICSLAKRFEEIFFYKNNEPIHLEENSEELKLIQFIRNEAHNFAIKFHRHVRNKCFFE